MKAGKISIALVVAMFVMFITTATLADQKLLRRTPHKPVPAKHPLPPKKPLRKPPPPPKVVRSGERVVVTEVSGDILESREDVYQKLYDLLPSKSEADVAMRLYELLRRRAYLVSQHAPETMIQKVDQQIVETLAEVSESSQERILQAIEEVWDYDVDYMETFNVIFTNVDVYRPLLKAHWERIVKWRTFYTHHWRPRILKWRKAHPVRKLRPLRPKLHPKKKLIKKPPVEGSKKSPLKKPALKKQGVPKTKPAKLKSEAKPKAKLKKSVPKSHSPKKSAPKKHTH
ncbi:hypothetical protein J7M23_06225 [Candidatus Sumerlaeota bacterium]|nr:hypothetical protein [Candidatus Sumerlaeota bacterium]